MLHTKASMTKHLTARSNTQPELKPTRSLGRMAQATLTATVLWMAAAGAHAQSYTFTTLGTFGGSSTYANGINNFGQVVGYSLLSGDSFARSATWTIAGGYGFDGLGDLGSYYTGINNVGQIVGVNPTTVAATGVASVWSSGISTALLRPGTESTAGTSINSTGQVAGHFYTGGNSTMHAAMWSGSALIDLGTLPTGTFSNALGINDTGQVVGYADSVELGRTSSFAVLWAGGRAIKLGSGGANAINNAGLIVGSGQGTVGSGSPHASLWNGNTQTDLGTIAGLDQSNALAINNLGQIVGYSDTGFTGTQRATLWNGTSATDLNMFAIGSGWVLQTATGINDFGWITGTAVNSVTGLSSAYVLAPVPLPASLPLMLAGLGSLGLFHRRRSSLSLWRHLRRCTRQ